MITVRESLLPRYANLSIKLSHCTSTEMLVSTQGYPGVGWCITSVIVVLIESPKLLQASENLSTLCCMSASEAVLRAQSSANRKTLMVSVKSLVYA